MTQAAPQETDYINAPGLLLDATTAALTAKDCHLDYWFNSVANGDLRDSVAGHHAETQTPLYMQEDGFLRDALMDEFAFRSLAEEKATRAICYMVANAPDIETMEFFATQVIDEGRHSRVFRGHLLELGVAASDLLSTIDQIAGDNKRKILDPLEKFALPIVRDQKDFIGGVVILTILVEGVLAPAAELSERKWHVLDPAAAEIERGANRDEIRHLSVGASVVREYLLEKPHEKNRILDIILRGRKLWKELPTDEAIIRRELLFQAGLEQHKDIVGDYEIWEGRKLVDTTPEERLLTANQWSLEMQNNRLTYMGLEEAI